MANPRKFSEKIAIQIQKQAEETAAFEQIMKEVIGVTRGNNGQATRKTQHLHINPSVGSCRAESLPNVNHIGTSDKSSIDLISALNNLEDMRHGRDPVRERRHPSPTGLDRSVHHYQSSHHKNLFSDQKRVDSSPYSPVYLSPPPMDTNWRRTHSDSALHQTSLMVEQMHENPQQFELTSPHRSSVHNMDTTMIVASDDANPNFISDVSLMVWGPDKKVIQSVNNQQLLSVSLPNDSRPKSCEVPGITIYPTQEDSSAVHHHVPFSSNTGSLPDLTSLHMPAPLSTPIDLDDQNLTSVTTTLESNVINQAPVSPYNASPTINSPFSYISTSFCNTNSNYGPQSSYSPKCSHNANVSQQNVSNHQMNAKVLTQNGTHIVGVNSFNNSECDPNSTPRLSHNTSVVTSSNIDDPLLRGQDFSMSSISTSFDTNDLFVGDGPPIDFEKILTGITDTTIYIP